MSFFRQLAKDIGDDSTYVADDGMHSSEFSKTIDTGSYILNALLSGSIFGGVPDNKITGFAGESATGKTFFVLGIVKQYLDDNKDGGVVYYDTEAAVTKDMMKERGIDTSRLLIVEKATVEEFRTHVSQLLDKYMATKTRPPMMIVLDSLGQLSTKKEIGDINEGKDARDMTRAQLIRGTFRALSLKIAKAKVPMIVTNHVADQIGAYVPTKVMGGGSGLRYAASQIIFLSKKKEREGTEVVGNFIHCKTEKSRFTKENQMVDVKLSYSYGLDRYYGLLELGEDYGIIKRIGNRYEFPNGDKAFLKNIMKVPQDFFTPEVLKLLDDAAGKRFKYGKGDRYTEIEPEDVELVEGNENE